MLEILALSLHFTATINAISCKSGAQKATVAAVTFVREGITTSGTFYLKCIEHEGHFNIFYLTIE